MDVCAEVIRAAVAAERPVQDVSIGIPSGEGQVYDGGGVAIPGVVGVLSEGILEFKGRGKEVVHQFVG